MYNFYDPFSNVPYSHADSGETEKPDSCCNNKKINLSIYIGLSPCDRWNNFRSPCCNQHWICNYPRRPSRCGRCWDFFDF